jgi:formate-dependent nitrite reductase membrane component NrfD
MLPLCVYSAECFLCLMSFPHPASAVWVWVLVVGVVGVGVVVDALGVVGDAQETN